MSDRPPRDRWLLVLSFCWIFLLIAFFLFKIIVPSGDDGWSTRPAVDLLIIAAPMLCLAVLCMGYSYRAWTKDADEFAAWLIAQQLFGASWTGFWIEFFSKEYYLWSYRLMGPLVVVLMLSILVLLVLLTSGVIAGRIPL